MNHLNYFEPYHRQDARHENQLTRAFLVLVRVCPQVHAAFLELVRDRQVHNKSTRVVPPLSSISKYQAAINTQIKDLQQNTGTAISIVLTDEHWTPTSDVGESDRRPVFDGVMSYDPDWILVIENKPLAGNIWEGQLSLPLPEDSEIEIDPTVVDLRWSDVIAAITSLLDRALIGGGEALLAGDFLDFVAEHFEFLNPYTNLAVCKGNSTLITRRCTAILEELKPDHVKPYPGGEPVLKLPDGVAQFVALMQTTGDDGATRIMLGMWPGDTTNQARMFAKGVDRESFFGLHAKGWVIAPNLHFSFAAKNLVWPKGRMQLQEYMDYWFIKRSDFEQVKRGSDNFDDFWDQLVRDGAALEDERTEFVANFTDTDRGSLNICPGFELRWSWPLVAAEKLDRSGEFVQAVRQQIAEAMATWGQEL